MTRIEEIKIRCAAYPTIRADVDYLLAENKRIREALEANATTFDNLAVILENWANESRNGSWSTHQVSANRQQAEYCRRDAAKIRAALKGTQS